MAIFAAIRKSMKNCFGLLLLLCAFASAAQTAYNTKKIPQCVTRFGTTLDDDYSWLENTQSPEVKDWVALQNQAVQKQLEVIGDKKTIGSKLREYDRLATNSLPSKRGKYFYGMYRLDKDKPSVLMMAKSLRHSMAEVVNPYKLFKDENVFIAGYRPSQNAKYISYGLSRNGGDRLEIRFADMEKLAQLDDVLTDIKFSGMAWNGDRGIFYKKNSNKQVFARDSTYQLYYHRIGQPQSADQLVFDATKNESNIDFFVKENKLFVIETSKDENLRKYYFSPIDTETFMLTKFLENESADFKLLDYSKNRIYFSSREYDWGEVRSFDIGNRTDEQVLIPQIYGHLLQDVDFLDDYVICSYKTAGKYYLSVYDRQGNFIRKFDALPGMDFKINFYDAETKCLYVSFFSYTLPYHNFKLNLENGDTAPFFTDYSRPKPTIFPLDYFQTKVVAYKSRDQKEITMTIVYKKGLALDSNNPTLLEAYGGFGSVRSPSFDTGLLYFLEKGGVYAYAEIRGGGEKGSKWHKDGKGLKKMNTFNDFIDAAEFLIAEGYTSSQKLAITGGSQGGLLVGVAITQRPELFKLAIPRVGAFDMVKFQNYTVGKYHLDEYGDAETEAGFRNLMSYSPYHNIKEDINYPSTLIITSENDDRVPPIHSYKFAARLQNRPAQKNPVFLQTRSNSGHYGKISTYNYRVEQEAEFYSFVLYYLNN